MAGLVYSALRVQFITARCHQRTCTSSGAQGLLQIFLSNTCIIPANDTRKIIQA